MEKTYALIKDLSVINTIIVEEENLSLLEDIKEFYNAEECIEVSEDQIVEIGYTYNGLNFVNPNPNTDPGPTFVHPEGYVPPEE